ncbi:PaaX family transcriptional regulator [Actinoplanes philippinensis]|uniref:Phenylacetic acid degradation operon negative regulatory protein n=1 Tax=Actinoplanes philippinensis TaxID=35752 RepID=A0A1I2I934_9ACTN|nr:PaaX family transcriptional regulator C-terminal domain-containing protein [Actinoplanes philippinensis]GIE78535.1 PaaX family transcriptional regulator [Actinoplanes philippinensis]SFF38193.1 phenylacetic acid degradation operon negative regulatory protein [Actinoplanes philippinensis]
MAVPAGGVPAVDPFDIEEIFPDVDTGSVLPRRQAGGSPQGLAVTLVADYTLSTLAWLPSAAIVALLGESGVSSAGARTAVSRLARRGVLEGSRHGRHSSYRLTPAAAAGLSAGGARIAAFAAPADSWDGFWTLVAFSLPKEEGTRRRALRGRLRWLGYAPLYDGLWVSPHAPGPTAQSQLAAVGTGAMTVFRARHVELGATAGRDPIAAWDLDAVARQYDAFLARWQPLLPRIRSGVIVGAEAVRARTEVMDTYRRFPVLDPLLPTRLLPPGWLRAGARETFTAVYDGLAEPAEQHVRAVVAGSADGFGDGVRAHTVAQLNAVSGIA